MSSIAMWRSEEMQLVQLFVQVEAARDTVDELGALGLVQFLDMNSEQSAFHRNFVNEVKRFDEMERKLRFFEEQVAKADVDMNEAPLTSVDTGVDGGVASTVLMDELEAKFEDLENELIQMNSNQEMLDRNYNELVELKHVLDKDSLFFDESGFEDTSVEQETSGLLEDKSGVRLGCITGVINWDKMNAFERILWRATRGNMFKKHSAIEEPIKDPQSGELVEKSVFIIFFQGDRLQQKIKKICEAFGANIYPCPDTPQQRAELRRQLTGRLEELGVVRARTAEHNRRVMLQVALSLETWKTQVIKEKSIYHTMNMFNYDVGRKCLIAEAWCPTTATEDIQLALRRATEKSGAVVPSILNPIRTKKTPPTYFKTNKYTESFQAIVDSYGVARYGEVNPAVFTIVTFPFLFGVMFGDFGHGLMMTMVAYYFIKYEQKYQGVKLFEMIQFVYDGRYVIFLMGIFAMYCGILYNECFAVPMIGGFTKWKFDHEKPGDDTKATFRKDDTFPIVFSVDYYWKFAKNSLDYYNSLKMKMSVILGVTQMVLGICISCINAVHWKKKLDIFCEFLPQLLFMLCTFGYMCFLVILKWCIKFDEDAKESPPSLLNVMIEMFLSPQHVSAKYKLPGFGPIQQFIQPLFLVIALLCVPWMLLPKPLILRSRHRRRHAYHKIETDDDDEEIGKKGGEEEEEEEFEFSEVMIHQVIHTIEFVLGAISNTASYLRLWALSLAHSELAEVFFDMILFKAFKSVSGVLQVPAIFLAFAFWGVFTVGVLLVMESLSAFLHALRLHWVEFQNKFYRGDGHRFTPFSYKDILAEEAA